MTINEAVELVDRMKPNQYDHETKVRWLSKLDGMIFWEVIATHEGSTLTQFDGYGEADPDTVLLVPYPYDEDIYNYFLQSQIDKENGEMAKYNQSVVLYNNAIRRSGTGTTGRMCRCLRKRPSGFERRGAVCRIFPPWRRPRPRSR